VITAHATHARRKASTIAAATAFETWMGCEQPGFTPDPFQALVIDAVLEALLEKCFFPEVIFNRAKEMLAASPEYLAMGINRIDQPDFRMDCCYARLHILAWPAH
jgi:hypothetical protein